MTERTKIISVRVSPEERFRLEEKAEDAGLRLSEYVRSVALSGVEFLPAGDGAPLAPRRQAVQPKKPERIPPELPPSKKSDRIEKRAKQLHYSKGMTMSLARRVAFREAGRG